MANVDHTTPPWWVPTTSGQEIDYTRSRSAGVSYTMDDLIGRNDYKKYNLTTDDSVTVSGTGGTVLR